MSDSVEQIDAPASTPDLKEALNRVRLVATDKADSVADLAAAERARLELLADHLAGVFAEIPEEMECFSPGMTGGNPPRLWIDMTTHVAMGRDRRTYRLLKDTRQGRAVLAETADRGAMAEAVTDYIAERVIECEKSLEGDWLIARGRRARTAAEATDAGAISPATGLLQQAATVPGGVPDHRRHKSDMQRAPRHAAARAEGGSSFLSFILGMIVGAMGLLAFAWMVDSGSR